MENKKAEQQVDLIKATFKNNDALAQSIRKAMYQFPLNAVDLAHLNSIKDNKELFNIIKAQLLPEFTEETTIGIQGDAFMSIPMKDLPPDMAILHVKGVKLWRDYLKQQLKALENGTLQEKQKISYKGLEEVELSDEQVFINFFARTHIARQVDSQLLYLLSTANEVKKTPEQLKKEQEKNSSK